MDTAADHARGVGRARPSPLLLVIAYLGFISLGLPDTVAGVAWPAVRATFDLPQSGLGLIGIALACGYFASSFFGGKLTGWLGIGTLLTISSLLVAAAMFGNALAPVWPAFIFCAVVWGLGSGAIDAGLNTYAASHFSARHLNWLHACYSLGASIGPLLMTAALIAGGSWRIGYAAVGGIVLALTLCFLITRGRWSGGFSGAIGIPTATMGEALRQPLVWLQVAVFFVYTGLEFMVGSWCFTLLTESRGVSAETAGIVASCYYGSIGVGRVVLGGLADRIGVDRLLRGSSAAAVVGTLLFAVSNTSLTGSVAGLVILGLGLAPIFPCLMARTPARLGPAHAAHAVGFQVSAATIGGAALPALAGLLAERINLEVVAQLAVTLAATLWLSHEVLLRWSRATGGAAGL